MLPDSITKLLDVLGHGKAAATQGQRSTGISHEVNPLKAASAIPGATSKAISPGLRCMTLQTTAKGPLATARELLQSPAAFDGTEQVLSPPACDASEGGRDRGTGSPEPGPTTPDTTNQRAFVKEPSDNAPNSENTLGSPDRPRAYAAVVAAHANLALSRSGQGTSPLLTSPTKHVAQGVRHADACKGTTGREDVSPPGTPVGVDTSLPATTPKGQVCTSPSASHAEHTPSNTPSGQRATAADVATAATAAAMATAALVATSSFQRPACKSPVWPQAQHSGAPSDNASESDVLSNSSRRTSQQGSFAHTLPLTPSIDSSHPVANAQNSSSALESKSQSQSRSANDTLLKHISVSTEPTSSCNPPITSPSASSAAAALSDTTRAPFLPDWSAALHEASRAAAKASGAFPAPTRTVTQRRATEPSPASAAPTDACIPSCQSLPTHETPTPTPGSNGTTFNPPPLPAHWRDTWAPLIPVSDLIPTTIPPPSRPDSAMRAFQPQYDTSSSSTTEALAATAELVEAIWRRALPAGVGYSDFTLPGEPQGPGAAAVPAAWEGFLPTSSESGAALQGVVADWRTLQDTAAAVPGQGTFTTAPEFESLGADSSAVDCAVAAASALLASEPSLGPLAWGPGPQAEADAGMAAPWPAWLAPLIAGAGGTDIAAASSDAAGSLAAVLRSVQQAAALAPFASLVPSLQEGSDVQPLLLNRSLAEAAVQDELKFARTAADLASLLALQSVDALARVTSAQSYLSQGDGMCHESLGLPPDSVGVRGQSEVTAPAAGALAAKSGVGFTPLSPGEPLPGPPHAARPVMAPVGAVMRRERSVAGDSPAHWRQAWSDEPGRDAWLLSANTPCSQVSSTHLSAARALFSPLGPRLGDSPGAAHVEQQGAAGLLPAKTASHAWPQGDAKPIARSLLSESVAGLHEASAGALSGAAPARRLCESPCVQWTVASILEEPEEWQGGLQSVFSPPRPVKEQGGALAAALATHDDADSEEQQPQSALRPGALKASPARDIMPPHGSAPVPSSALSHTARSFPPVPVSVLAHSHGSAAMAPARAGLSSADPTVIPPPVPKPPLMYRRVIFPARLPQAPVDPVQRPTGSSSDPGAAQHADSNTAPPLARRHSLPDAAAAAGPAPAEPLRVSASEGTSHVVLPSNVVNALLSCAANSSKSSAVECAQLSAPCNFPGSGSRVRKSEGGDGASNGLGSAREAEAAPRPQGTAASPAAGSNPAPARSSKVPLPASPTQPLSPTMRTAKRAPVFTVPVRAPRTAPPPGPDAPGAHTAQTLTPQELRAVDAKLAQVREARPAAFPPINSSSGVNMGAGPYATPSAARDSSSRDSVTAAIAPAAQVRAAAAVSVQVSLSEGGSKQPRSQQPALCGRRRVSAGGAVGVKSTVEAQPDLVWNQAASSALNAAQAAMSRPLPPTLVVAARSAPSKADTKAATSGRRRPAAVSRDSESRSSGHSSSAQNAVADILPPMPSVTEGLLRSVQNALSAIHARGEGARSAQSESRA